MRADPRSTNLHPDATRTEDAPAETDQSWRQAASTYPELIPVITSVVDAMIYTFNLDQQEDAELIDQLAEIAVAKSRTLYGPMAAIADQVSHYTQHLREAQAANVIRVAETIAARVAEEATALHTRNEAVAVAVARNAADAAAIVAAAVGPDDDRVAVAAAAAAANDAVRHAAARAAAERAYGAATVAQRAADAAADAAEEAELLALTVELNAATTAAHAKGLAMDTYYEAAIEATTATAEQILTKGDKAAVDAARFDSQP